MAKVFEDELIIGKQLRRFRKDESIYFEDDSAETWFEVAEGVVRTCRFHADGYRQVTGFHYPGDVFGLEDRTRVETAEAVTDAVCWYTSRHPAEADHPAAVAGDYESALRKALDSTGRCIFLHGRRTAPERLATFLLQTADQLHVQSVLELPMCRTDIADYLGLTIHTVSRTITQLCVDELIALDGFQSCRILDRAGLMALAGVVVASDAPRPARSDDETAQSERSRGCKPTPERPGSSACTLEHAADPAR